jgi:outer membrane protein
MKNIFTCTIVAMCFAFAEAQSPKIWTLQECVKYAIDNNISIKQADLSLLSAEVDKKDAVGSFLPTLNANANNSWNTGLTQNITTGVLQTQTTRNSSYGVSSGVSIYNGSRNIYRLQRAKMSIIAAQYNTGQIEDNIMLNVSNAYLNVLFNKENLKQFEVQHIITTEQLKLTEDLVEAGSLPRGDILEVKATFANEEQQIIAAANDIQISKITLAQILNLDAYEVFDIENPEISTINAFVLDGGVDAIFDSALDNRYEVKIAEQNTALAEQDVKLAQAESMPSLNAFFNYNTRESGQGRFSSFLDPDSSTRPIGIVESTGETVVAPNFATSVGNPLPFFNQLSNNDGITYGIAIQLPIFNGFAVKNNIERSKISVANNKLVEAQTKLDLKRNIFQAFNDATGSRASYEASQEALDARTLAVEYARSRFNVGLMNAFDFNQAQTQLTNAQINVLRAKYDYIFRLKILELFTGVSPDELKF